MIKIKSNSLDSFMTGLKIDYNSFEACDKFNSTGSVKSIDSEPKTVATHNDKKMFGNKNRQSDSSFPSVESLHTGKRL